MAEGKDAGRERAREAVGVKGCCNCARQRRRAAQGAASARAADLHKASRNATSPPCAARKEAAWAWGRLGTGTGRVPHPTRAKWVPRLFGAEIELRSKQAHQAPAGVPAGALAAIETRDEPLCKRSLW